MTKTTNILIRVSEEEKKAIKENAEKAQLTVSKYLRTMAIYGEVKE